MEVYMNENSFHGLGERLALARSSARLSLREAAASLTDDCRVSHVMLGKYERSLVIPPLNVLVALANLYKRPLTSFFSESPRLTGIRYRNAKSMVRQRDRTWFEANAQRWLDAYVRLERRLEQPLTNRVKVPTIAHTDDPVKVASEMRKALGIRCDAPIPSVIECIERCGIRVIELPTELKIDGIAGRFGHELVVVLNPSSAHDRSRMNAAHEWGHVLFGHCVEGKSAMSDMEEEITYDYASHFIIPDGQLREAFRGESMVRLVKFKETFGVSLAAMIFRAEKAGILKAQTARHLWIEFAKRGWRMNEPGHVRADRATRFEQLLEGAITRKSMSWRDAEAVTGIPTDELKHRLGLAMGLENSEPQEDSEERGTLKFKEPEEPR
jgi:Zn-dependent peptidase ImmA (M78 family)/transcriptional regulator with XRE-family HTH domain